MNRKVDIFHEKDKPSPVNIKAIASGSSHCLALTTNGNVYSWGNG